MEAASKADCSLSSCPLPACAPMPRGAMRPAGKGESFGRATQPWGGGAFKDLLSFRAGGSEGRKSRGRKRRREGNLLRLLDKASDALVNVGLFGGQLIARLMPLHSPRRKRREGERKERRGGKEGRRAACSTLIRREI